MEILSPTSGPAIEALDLMDLLQDPAVARPCLGIHRRWGVMQTEIDDFFCHRGGAGFVIDRACFDIRLRAMAKAAGVSFVEGRVINARRRNTEIDTYVKTGSGEITVSAAIAVDASGRPSILARRLGARRLLVERLVAERRSLDESRSPSQEPAWLYVEGSNASWSYGISGPDGRREEWAIYRDRSRSGASNLKRTNASSACLSQAAGKGWLAIGDAAMSFDPITSQGLVNALTTALVAAGAILSSRSVCAATASAYSEAVAATFRNSERGRAAVYGALNGIPTATRMIHSPSEV